jgi:phage tail-like protein
MPSYYPPVGFHFRVQVLDLTATDDDMRFTEVAGLSMELASEEVPEGGENRFVQKYPTRAKYPDLVLKRGLMLSSKVAEWIRECVQDLRITPKNVDITLLNEAHEPLLTWHVQKAWPTKWSVSDLNATSNTFVVETLQLSYQTFTLDRA